MATITEKKVGEKIKKMRKTRGITQKQLGEYLRFPQDSVSQIENGKKPISLEVLRDLSNFFNVSSDYLLGITETPNILKDDNDENVRISADYTGLSNKAISLLNMTYDLNPDYNLAVSNIVETLELEMGYIYAPEEYEPIEQPLLLSRIVSYLGVDLSKSSDVLLSITKGGNLVDYANTDDKVLNKMSWEDLFSIDDVYLDSVIEQTLINSIIDGLKKLKREKYSSTIKKEDLPF